MYKVDDFGSLQGRQAMMSEIYHRGPIVCSIFATKEFEQFTGLQNSYNLKHSNPGLGVRFIVSTLKVEVQFCA